MCIGKYAQGFIWVGQYSIELNSINGQLLYRNKIEGPTNQIDLSSFQKGLYIITIRSMTHTLR
ncbi:MAG: T9SS type A sorting domain-containing protein [Candidatus Kariarchaeaceae archaeon]